MRFSSKAEAEVTGRGSIPLMVPAVAMGALVLGVADYFLWTAEVDDPVWGPATGLLDWVLALVFVVCVAIVIRRALKSRPS
jgi:hypothetical protein